ncbi:MAG: 4Fe-4S binding protein, partial [Desulfobacterales bacterium]|nr:4Fe-4S binding protein [Desulfobacterales bacterium]
GCPLHERTLPGFKKKRPFGVNGEKCRNHRYCISRVACPAFMVEGGSVRIDADRCTGCSLCAQLCPEKAIQTVSPKAVRQ